MLDNVFSMKDDSENLSDEISPFSMDKKPNTAAPRTSDL
jgi:hypothetical protein